MKTFLITGVTGFLGSFLADKLLKSEYRIIGIGRKKRGFLTKELIDNDKFILLNNNIEDGSTHALDPISGSTSD